MRNVHIMRYESPIYSIRGHDSLFNKVLWEHDAGALDLDEVIVLEETLFLFLLLFLCHGDLYRRRAGAWLVVHRTLLVCPHVTDLSTGTTLQLLHKIFHASFKCHFLNQNYSQMYKKVKDSFSSPILPCYWMEFPAFSSFWLGVGPAGLSLHSSWFFSASLVTWYNNM